MGLWSRFFYAKIFITKYASIRIFILFVSWEKKLLGISIKFTETKLILTKLRTRKNCRLWIRTNINKALHEIKVASFFSCDFDLREGGTHFTEIGIIYMKAHIFVFLFLFIYLFIYFENNKNNYHYVILCIYSRTTSYFHIFIFFALVL